MGLFDKFKQYNQERNRKAYERYGDTLKNAVTTKEQRLEAIEALGDAPIDIAVPQLLKRFDLVVDHGIQDNREKEMVSEQILKHKDAAKPYLQNALANQKRISWPIKLAEKLFDKSEYTNLLLENLHPEFVGFDEAVQERNIEILLALKDLSDERIVEKAKPLLKSRDEHVRIAALECLESQGESSQTARSAINELLTQPASDDNSRFLGLVKSIVDRHKWA